jgi:hypothetical protein
MRGKAVAIDVDDVDVCGAQSYAFFEDARALVDQRLDAALDDFLGGNLALRYPSFGNPLTNKGGD